MATDQQRENDPPPSWLFHPCPRWCTRTHAESDHPEDRIHLDDGIVVPGMVGSTDPATMRLSPRSVELVLQRRLDVTESPGAPPWVGLQEAEGMLLAIFLSSETADLLQQALASFTRP